MSLRIALLGLLSRRGPLSGYDLAKRVERSVGHVWHARHSQIYPELAKMHNDGVIRVKDEGPRGRKIYEITDDGGAELRTWLLDHQPSVLLRSEWALKAFLLPLLTPTEALAVVDQMRTTNRRALESIESMEQQLRPKFEADDRSLGQYALDLGLRFQRMLGEWVEDVDAHIRRHAEERRGAEERPGAASQ